MKLHIKTCPSCGRPIKRVCRNWKGSAAGKTFTVPSLEFYECSGCGEKVFDVGAMERIEAATPSVIGAKRHAVIA